MPRPSTLLLPSPRCANCPVRNKGICCALSDEHLDELAEIMIHRRYAAGSEIVHQEDTSQLFAIILDGTVKLTRVLQDGRQQIVGLLSASDSIGDLYADVSHDSAECVTDVTLCCFPRKRFETIFDAHPELQRQLLLRVMNDLDETRQWILALGQKNASERVASFLLWLTKRQADKLTTDAHSAGEMIIDCPFARREIAEFLGLTLETVSRQFTKLRSAGVIKLHAHRRIQILDLDALRLQSELEQ
jgi:CRP/FNR family transcriptional regulator